MALLTSSEVSDFKLTILVFAVCLPFVPPISAKEVNIRGYVTDVSSPTIFEIEDYRITRDFTRILLGHQTLLAG